MIISEKRLNCDKPRYFSPSKILRSIFPIVPPDCSVKGFQFIEQVLIVGTYDAMLRISSLWSQQ
jgi:hypothetical protein